MKDTKIQLTSRQKSLLQIAVLVNVGLFILELIAAKYGYIQLGKIGRFKLGFLLLPALIANILLLILNYYSWFRSKKKGILVNVKKAFFWLLVLGLGMVWLSVYTIFIFDLL